MTAPATVTVEPLSGPGAARSASAFLAVYAEVFAEPPYDEPAEGIASAAARFPDQTARPGFLAALATAPGGEPVGMAFGHAVPPDTPWWDELAEPVPASLRREDGRRTFGLMELAVRAPWRGRGIARRLHDTLLTGITAERVLLNVHGSAEPAAAAYRSWGYRKVGESGPFGPGADRYDVMLLALPG
ncbi:GNAT family N-acetyltransferase [Streptomyces sp. NPDC059524]|uniref:GNAT family N-acetyltransferase n=1 Tax=Streptomyces sp. NPDC059524 TaxID=3346856 RepID=UPI0036C248F8